MSSPGPKRERDRGRKWESGASKRRRKAEMMKLLSQTASSSESSESITSSPTKGASVSHNPVKLEIVQDVPTIYPQPRLLETESETNSFQVKLESEIQVTPLSNIIKEDIDEIVIEIDSLPVSSDVMEEEKPDFGSLDPGLWTLPLTETQRRYIVRKGPEKPFHNSDEVFPKDGDHRHFSNFYFLRRLNNGETLRRRWLVYSKSKDKVFCFPCRLFSNAQTQMVQEGCCDWKHLSSILQRHENTKEHKAYMYKWIILENELKSIKKIDYENEMRILESQKKWFMLFERLIEIINFLASHNLAFKCSETVKTHKHVKDSSNFLDLFKLISKFDSTLKNHIKRINKEELTQHYLSQTIQNELIALMSKAVIDEIIGRIKEAKYYSILFDCTRDFNGVEQISIILRYCNITTGTIEENFIGFLDATEINEEYLINAILKELAKNGLSIENCRGQGYDNGANIVNVNSKLKARILHLNPRAFFTPCGRHSWNNILADVASSSMTAKKFFGFLRKIFMLFSSSIKRWESITEKLKLDMQLVSDTRWESEIQTVEVLLLQFDNVVECIENLLKQSEQSDILSECYSLVNEMLTFEFVVALHVWYEILKRIHFISKLWQSDDVNLGIVLENLSLFCKWIKEYRQTGFEKCVLAARQFIEKSKYDIPKDFTNKEIIKKKKKMDYESGDESMQLAKNQYEINFFNSMIDAIISDIDSRHKSLNQFFEDFGFLYDVVELKNIPKEQLLKKCQHLHAVLRVGEGSDIQVSEFFDELQLMISNLPKSIKDVKYLVQYIKENNLHEIYPNVFIAMRILLSIPISTATAESSLSKLKLIKKYLENKMDNERLSNLAVLSIETDIASKIDYESIIKEFSRAKSKEYMFI